MPVPKKRQSKSRKNTRKFTWKQDPSKQTNKALSKGRGFFSKNRGFFKKKVTKKKTLKNKKQNKTEENKKQNKTSDNGKQNKTEENKEN